MPTRQPMRRYRDWTVAALLAASSLLVSSCEKGFVAPDEPMTIYDGQRLGLGFGLGIALSDGTANWIEQTDEGIRMDYPSGQTWGAVFITAGGDPSPSWKPYEDLSSYRLLAVDLKGGVGGESISIVVQDTGDTPGEETAIPLSEIRSTWTTYFFCLKDFETADLTHVYVPIKFVFEGRDGRTVYFSNVRYLP